MGATTMPNKRRSKRASQPHVTIIGAGISGLTAALRLAERGYAVTVYEERPEIGGNLAGYQVDGGRYDVYPHMFGNFYQNFWDLVEGDLGLTRGEGGDFEARTTFKILDKGAFPRFSDLLNVGTPDLAWTNLLSGVAPPAAMLLWAYSSIDGLSYSLADDSILDKVSVEGFLRTRPYATPDVAALHDTILMTIWSVHGYETSAAAYRRFVEHTVPLPRPLFWLLTGDLGTKLMRPLRQKVERQGAAIETSTRVVEIVTRESATPRTRWEIAALKIQATQFDTDTQRHRPVGPVRTVPVDREAGDAVILAVPPLALSHLVATGPRGHRIVDALPALSEVRRLAAEPIPVLNLYFKTKLPDIPKESVLLRGSSYNLTLLDLSQIWHDEPNMKYRGRDRTALCVAASDYFALPSANVDEEAHRMLWQLHEYLDLFNPGDRWGDPKSDIDWEMTHFNPNTSRMLFANTVGGKEWQPETHYPDAISNLFFAGDCTINPIRMATVESAVTSGLQAASETWKKHQRGTPIEIRSPPTLPLPLILGLKALMTPSAYAAKCWSNVASILPHLAKGDIAAAQASMATTTMDIYATPYLMAADLWQSMVRAMAAYSACAARPAARSIIR
jgi:hypothetical protein